MDDLISRKFLLREYDRLHEGPPGRARKIIEEAPSAVMTARKEAYHGPDGHVPFYRCEACGEAVYWKDRYCCECGRRFI